jgi:hypothetical protein
MNQSLKNRLLVILEHPSALLGFALIFIAHIASKLSGERNTKKRDNQLADEIRENLPFLFADYGAQFVPNEVATPPYFDWAQARILASGLLFMFTRDRGMIYVNVAPAHAAQDWQELSAVLTFILNKGGMDSEVEFARLPTIALVLEPQMKLLMEALSKAQLESTKKAVLNIAKRRSIQQRLAFQADLSERKKRLGLR